MFEEVAYNFSWGNLAGKWWGPRNVRPVIMIHGWQDSAGSFDTLVPLLPKQYSYLAIDLPGHGFSSWIPNGLSYQTFDIIFLLNELSEQQNWSKISIIGHSMGAIISFFSAAIFPDKIDFIIALDALKPRVWKPRLATAAIEYNSQGLYISDKRNRSGSAAPRYTYEDVRKLFYDGWKGEVGYDKIDHLVARNARKSPEDQNLYCLTRDRRVKYIQGFYLHHETGLEFIKRIKCPYLYFRGNSGSFTENPKYIDETIHEFKEYNPLFEVVRVNGFHYFHLITPEVIAGDISRFIHKYRSNYDDKVQSKL